MKERPIVFSSESVCAILEGRKTQTRRVMKVALHPLSGEPAAAVYPVREGGWIPWWPDDNPGLAEFTKRVYKIGNLCPYGVPSDQLWVRESIRRKNLGWLEGATYLADLTPVMEDGGLGCRRVKLAAWKWKRDVLSARFMPRWASRITLEIVDIRVERLQDISEEDAEAEGI